MSDTGCSAVGFERRGIRIYPYVTRAQKTTARAAGARATETVAGAFHHDCGGDRGCVRGRVLFHMAQADQSPRRFRQVPDHEASQNVWCLLVPALRGPEREVRFVLSVRSLY